MEGSGVAFWSCCAIDVDACAMLRIGGLVGIESWIGAELALGVELAVGGWLLTGVELAASGWPFMSVE